MASDFGDDSGEKMVDSFVRFGERMGEDAMRRRADMLRSVFERAKPTVSGQENSCGNPTEWAKLDMHEFQTIDDYDDIKQVIEEKLKAHDVDTAWFADKQAGQEYLLFRIADTHEVWKGFDELSHETDAAAAKASAAVKKAIEEKRDARPLEQRAADARTASEALEKSRAGKPARGREPKIQETRTR